MRTCPKAQELFSELCGDRNGKKIQKRGALCRHVADSPCWAVGTNTAL